MGIHVSGWKDTRILPTSNSTSNSTSTSTSTSTCTRYPSGGIPVFWTPTIKALWAPFLPLPDFSMKAPLPLHHLRLSASAAKLCFCGQDASDEWGIPLGIGLVVDRVLIEISGRKGEL